MGEVWENLHSTLTRGLAKAREARRAQAQLEVIDKICIDTIIMFI